MSFKYINPGYAELFSTAYRSGSKKSKFTTLNNELYNPINNIALNDNGSGQILLDNNLNQLYCKFDTYCTNSNMKHFDIYCQPSNGYNGVRIAFSGGIDFYVGSKNVYYKTGISPFIEINNINTCWLYLKARTDSSNNDGIIKVVINEKIFIDITDSSISFDDCDSIMIMFYTDNYSHLSNIILSDEYIDPKEQVIILPTSDVETDMTENEDGTYTADSAGQTILQKIDAKTLIQQYGAKSKIISIATAGIPAYRTSEGLSSLISIEKSDGQITEHNSKTLSTDTASGVIDVQNVSKTIADLDGKLFGWKVGT